MLILMYFIAVRAEQLERGRRRKRATSGRTEVKAKIEILAMLDLSVWDFSYQAALNDTEDAVHIAYTFCAHVFALVRLCFIVQINVLLLRLVVLLQSLASHVMAYGKAMTQEA